MKPLMVIVLVILFISDANAQSHYPGQHKGKFAIDNKLTTKLLSFGIHINEANLDQELRRVTGNDSLLFKSVSTGILFKPVSRIHRERYVVYWNTR